MEVEEAIRTRRSIGKVKADPVPREMIERIIEAAVWAPNHHLTEPWKFVVLTGEGRSRLGEAYAEIADESLLGVSGEEREQRMEREKAKAYRAPAVIAVACSPSDSPKVIRREELAAVHAAVQNLLLAAHATGLGAVWRSGEPAYHPAMKRALAFADEDEVVGLIYLGFPDMTPPERRREPGSSKTVWVEE
jgi:nitroreductase